LEIRLILGLRKNFKNDNKKRHDLEITPYLKIKPDLRIRIDLRINPNLRIKSDLRIKTNIEIEGQKILNKGN
jgi:hypothetical protein